MKPLQLSMTAFGPYKNKEIVDFTKLADHHLFVISGATGAGKTTIFDGICFALYGTASGTDRENTGMLRSHFADDDVHTSVELIFELNGRKYRVLRQLGHVKKGNKTRTGERYEFFEIVEEGVEIPSVDRQIVTEINDKLESIIGLTEDQFKQIVMLPQGEFRKLLTSETENKEAILRRLFKTERYKQMNGLLNEKRNHVNERFIQEKQILDHYIQSIHATLENRDGSNLFLLLNQDYYNVDQITQGLSEEIVYLMQKIKEDEETYTKTIRQFECKQNDLHQAISVNKQFTSLDDKKNELHVLHNVKDTFSEKEKLVERAERAAQIEPYELQVNERRKEREDKMLFLKQATERLTKVKSTLTEVRKDYIAEEKKTPEREKLTRDVERFSEFLPIVKEINQTKQMLQQLTTEIAKSSNNVAAATKFIEQKETEMESLKKELTNKEQQVRERTKKQEERYELRERYQAFDNYLQAKKKYDILQNEVSEKENIYKSTAKRFEELEAAWLQNQAVVLASHLHEGDACPVCGSNEHPELAVVGEEDITRETLTSIKVKLDKQQAAYQETFGMFHVTKEQLQTCTENIIPYDITPERVKEEIIVVVERGKKLKTEISTLDKLAEQIKTDNDLLIKMDESIKSARAQKEREEKVLADNRIKHSTLDATFTERLRHIPEEIQSLNQLQQKIKQTETLKEQLDNRWKSVQEKLKQTEEEHTTKKIHVENGKKDLEKINEIVNSIEAVFQEKLSLAQFENEQMYKVAKMTEENKQKLQKEIETYKQQKATLQKQIEELIDELKEKERADVTKISEEVEKLKRAYEVAFEQFNASKNYCDKAKELKYNITEVDQKTALLEQELATISDLYDVLRGHNVKKISFERYLQIDYLDQITAAANERFKTLTNGQFYLIRSERQETHGRQSGLAIDVYDSYTGQTRDVKTLSGGEKFIASLCLALGMSDVIQSFQGSISMETMFIDEGFGSLDEESLHKSIDALISLQQTGRMIGVISHVEELKTIFPAMLEVNKTKEGHSKTNFVLK